MRFRFRDWNRWIMVPLQLENTRSDQVEHLHLFSLSFQKPALEEQYQDYQFELARHNLVGNWGAMSITSLVALALMTVAYIQQGYAYVWMRSPGCFERMMAGIPAVIFAVHHQLQIRCSKGTDTKKTCKFFVLRFVLTAAITELFGSHINDAFRDSEGCPTHRFRCPYSFSSSKFAARGIFFAALIIFHLTPCSSFVRVVQLVMTCTASRFVGFFLFQEHFEISIWSIRCLYLHIFLLLSCRAA